MNINNSVCPLKWQYKLIIRIFLLLLLLDFIFLQKVKSQNLATVNIKFSSNWDVTKVKISFDNGRDKKKIHPIFTNNQLTISDSFFSKYATITLSYPMKNNVDHSNTFFLSNKQSSIYFNSDPEKSDKPLENYRVKNAIAVYKTYGGKQFMSDLKKDYDEYIHLILEAANNNTDSLQSILVLKDSIIFQKELNFLKKNGKYYFSLWFFRERFNHKFSSINPDTLLKIFNSSFPLKYIKSIEGIEMNTILNAWASIKHKQIAPLFTSKDIGGKTISLENFRGKYVLLNFWASWCIPCLQEMPLLKKLREEYSEDQLVIISVSYDTDSLAFKKWVDKLEMKWVNIYRDETIINLYGNTPIPASYLIDNNGKIIYTHFENSIEELPNILQKIKRK